MSRFGGISRAESIGIALVWCERTIVDAATGQKSLIGIYDTIQSIEFPFILPAASVYAAVRGQEVSEIFVGLFAPDGTAVVRSVFTVSEWGSDGTVEVDIPLANITFPVPGVYQLELFVTGAVLLERPIVVQMLPPPMEEQDD